MVWPFSNYNIYNLNNTQSSTGLNVERSHISSVIGGLNYEQRENLANKCIEANKGFFGVWSVLPSSTGLKDEQHRACYRITQIAKNDGLDVGSEQFANFTRNTVNACATDGYFSSTYNTVVNTLSDSWNKYGVNVESLEAAKKQEIESSSKRLGKIFSKNIAETLDTRVNFQQNNQDLADKLNEEASKLKYGKTNVFSASSNVNNILHDSVNTARENLNSNSKTKYVYDSAANKVFEQPSIYSYFTQTFINLAWFVTCAYVGYKLAKYAYKSYTNPERDWSVYNPWTNIKSFCSHPYQSTKTQIGNAKDFVKSNFISAKNYVVKGYEYVTDNTVVEKSSVSDSVSDEKDKKESEKAKGSCGDNLNVDHQHNHPQRQQPRISIKAYSDDLISNLGSNCDSYTQYIRKNDKTWIDLLQNCSMNQAQGYTNAIEKYITKSREEYQKMVASQGLDDGDDDDNSNDNDNSNNSNSNNNADNNTDNSNSSNNNTTSDSNKDNSDNVNTTSDNNVTNSDNSDNNQTQTDQQSQTNSQQNNSTVRNNT